MKDETEVECTSKIKIKWRIQEVENYQISRKNREIEKSCKI